MVEVLHRLGNAHQTQWREMYVKSYMQNLPLLPLRSMHIPERLSPIHRIHMYILLKRLAARLDLLRATPNAILATFSHLVIEASFLVLFGRSWRAWRAGTGMGRIFAHRGSSPWGSTHFANGGVEVHKVFGIVGDVVCETEADFFAVGEVAV